MTPDERGAVLMFMVQRIIDENEEIKQAALELARAYGEEGIRVSLEVTATVERAEGCECRRAPQQADYTARDRQFLKAMRIQE